MKLFENERAFTRWVLTEARKRNWLAAHPSNHQVVRRRDGTTMAVPDKNADGLPDVVIVHPVYGVVWAELKMPGRKPDEAQLRWLRALRAAGQVVYVWTTSDQDEILEVLEGRLPSGRLFVEAAAS